MYILFQSFTFIIICSIFLRQNNNILPLFVKYTCGLLLQSRSTWVNGAFSSGLPIYENNTRNAVTVLQYTNDLLTSLSSDAATVSADCLCLLCI